LIVIVSSRRSSAHPEGIIEPGSDVVRELYQANLVLMSVANDVEKRLQDASPTRELPRDDHFDLAPLGRTRRNTAR